MRVRNQKYLGECSVGKNKGGDTTTKVFRLLITPSSIAMKTLVDVAVLSCSVPSSATWAWP